MVVPLLYKFVVEFIISTFLAGTDASGVAHAPAGGGRQRCCRQLGVPIFVEVAGPDEPFIPVVFELLHFFGGSYGQGVVVERAGVLAYAAGFAGRLGGEPPAGHRKRRGTFLPAPPVEVTSDPLPVVRWGSSPSVMNVTKSRRLRLAGGGITWRREHVR